MNTVSLSMVGNSVYLTPGEAQAAAIAQASHSQEPVNIMEATVAADFQPIATVQPLSDRERRAMRMQRGGYRGQVVDLQGDAINLICIDVSRSLESTVCDIEDAAEGLVEGAGSGGCHYETGLAATDSECCLWRAEVTLGEAFDVRHPLPEQVAAWLREQASALMDAAERIAGVDDLRDLSLLRRYVDGDQAVRFDYESSEFSEVEADQAAA